MAEFESCVYVRYFWECPNCGYTHEDYLEPDTSEKCPNCGVEISLDYE